MDLTVEQMNWIGERLNMFIHSTQVSNADRIYIYSIYNHITGEKKRPNGCGRCWKNTKKRVYDQYIKQTNIY